MTAKISDPVQAEDLDTILAFLPRFRNLNPQQAAIREPGIREESGRL